jgi:citrate lyase beta subunit
VPQFFGIRIKPLNGASRERGLRTLDLFMRAIGRRVPHNFIVTLPKIETAGEVRTLVRALEPWPEIRVELMVETPQALRSLPQLIEAAQGRSLAAHFGAYDYCASLGITSARQDLRHPACDFARFTIQMQLAGTGIWLSDGATNLLPMGDRAAVHRGWKLHYDNVRYALENGFYQGWDLHPAQLPARFAAVFGFFLEGLPAASQRLKNFVAQSARATQAGGVFDDAATVRGLVNFFERAVSCGAIPECDLPALTGLTLEALRGLLP